MDSTKLDSLGPGTFPALSSALADQVALKLGNRGQQRREKPPLRRRRIPDRVAEAPEGRASLADTLDQVEQLAGRAAESVELRHHHHVAGLQGGHKLCQLRPIGPGPADLLLEDRGGAGRLQLLQLACQMLVLRRHAGSPRMAISRSYFASKFRKA
jgi:hypothetical protein